MSPTTRRSRPITTLARGDLVTVNLRGRASDRVNAWAGEVVGVDSVALRLQTHWSRFGLSVNVSHGERVLPWSRIDSVQLETAS